MNSDWILYPAYASALSAALVSIHFLVRTFFSRSVVSDGVPAGSRSIAVRTKAQIAGHGGIVIWTFEVIRLLGCAGLAGMSLILSLKDRYENANNHNHMLEVSFAFVNALLIFFSLARVDSD